jgi:flagellar motor switch protein FliG
VSASGQALVPVPRADRSRLATRTQGLAPIEKAAIILSAIGPEASREVLRALDAASLQRFVKVIRGLAPVSQDLLDAVIVEFLEAITAGAEVAGGDNAARRLLEGVLDEEKLAALFEPDDPRDKSVWERLNATPLGALATFLQAEHPQTVALVLSELKPETAASVLERLDREFAQVIVLRLARVPSLDARVAECVTSAIEREFLSVLQGNLSKRRPAELIAGLMNNISSEAREGFLGHLEAQMPALAHDVQRTMFTFEDIAARLVTRDVPAVIRGMDETVLLTALKLGEAQESASVAFILENIPRRLSERYAEELQAMEGVNRKEGEAAQMEVTRTIQALARAGEIKLLDREIG